MANINTFIGHLFACYRSCVLHGDTAGAEAIMNAIEFACQETEGLD